jgi:hypothetical protein
MRPHKACLNENTVSQLSPECKRRGRKDTSPAVRSSVTVTVVTHKDHSCFSMRRSPWSRALRLATPGSGEVVSCLMFTVTHPRGRDREQAELSLGPALLQDRHPESTSSPDVQGSTEAAGKCAPVDHAVSKLELKRNFELLL